MKKKIIIGCIILAVISIGIMGVRSCSKKKKAIVSQGHYEEITVHRGEIQIRLEETGEIQPIKQIAIKSKVSGKVLKFYVKENDFITKGQLIADIEPDYNQASTFSNIKNSLKIAEIRLKNAKDDYYKKQKLYEQKYISKEQMDASQDEMEKAKMDYSLAFQQFELIKEIDTSNNVSHVYATASGTVIQKAVEEGEMVVGGFSSFNEGTVLMKVADINQMIVKSSINEVDIAKVRMNMKVEINVDAYPYETFNGVVTKIAAMASTENNVKVFPIEITIFEKDSPFAPWDDC